MRGSTLRLVMLINQEKIIMEKQLYTQEQLDIELLKNTNSAIFKTLEHLDRQVNSSTNYILGLYGLVLTAVFAHIGGVF
jgi:hypothetical protein